jgi:predicted glycoside hydrolase/deacetylase ChbG (UPF0249 family)
MTGGGAIAERRLIINADDLGLSGGVNRGIVEAHAAGTVTSASLLANGPALSDAMRRLRNATTLQVGLHFNLTLGRPVAQREDVASLCDPHTGEFYSLARLVTRALTGRIQPEQVAAECRAQLDLLHKLGILVRHLDSHRHVHALPGVWKPVIAVAQRAGIRAVRVPRESLRPAGRRLSRALVAASLRAFCGDRALMRADHFLGLGLLGAHDFQRQLLVLLDRLEPGTTELMVHPGYVDPDLTRRDAYTTGRERELAGLCSRELRDRLTRGDIQLLA